MAAFEIYLWNSINKKKKLDIQISTNLTKRTDLKLENWISIKEKIQWKETKIQAKTNSSIFYKQLLLLFFKCR